jgi:hypothetical protein
MENTFKINKKLQQIENNVKSYLTTPPNNRKSIAFYGKGGEGKSLLIYRLMSDFEEKGYKIIFNEDDKIPISLGMDTRNIKRSNTWVIETLDEHILNDDRFMVFDFTK